MDRTSKEADSYTIRDLSFEPMRLLRRTLLSRWAMRSRARGTEGAAVRDAIMTSLVPVIFSLLPLCLSWLTNATYSAPHVRKEKLLWARCFFQTLSQMIRISWVAGAPPPPSSAASEALEEEPGKLLVLQVPPGDSCLHESLRSTPQTSFYPFNSHNNPGGQMRN